MFSNLERAKQMKGVAILSVVSNSLLVFFKILIGISIGSVSVISEAIHSGIDLLAALIALFAVSESVKPADKEHPYGHGKFENVSGTVEAVLIFLAAGWIIYEAVLKIFNPHTIAEPGWGVIIMFISALVNIVVSEMLFRVGKKNQSIALEADAWHLRTDVYTSLGVMLALFAIWLGEKYFPDQNLRFIDPAGAIFVAFLIIKAAYELTKKSALDLFDVSLPIEDVDWVNNLLKTHKSVKDFHKLKTRKSGKDRFIEFHLLVSPEITVLESHHLTDELTDLIRSHLPGSYVTIHVEPFEKV